MFLYLNVPLFQMYWPWVNSGSLRRASLGVIYIYVLPQSHLKTVKGIFILSCCVSWPVDVHGCWRSSALSYMYCECALRWLSAHC